MDSKAYVPHTKMTIPLGSTRVGGPIVDLPKGIPYPEGMFFAAQLNLNDFAKYDVLNLLPESGFLYFFVEGYGDSGKVFFSDAAVGNLFRVVKEHDNWFWDGCLVDRVYNEEEDFSSRYSKEWADKSKGKIVGWDSFAGSEKSKIYGIYTHCQKSEEEIRSLTNSDRVLLLQIGEDFNGEGVWSVLVKRIDLENRDFSHCEFEWGQS